MPDKDSLPDKPAPPRLPEHDALDELEERLHDLNFDIQGALTEASLIRAEIDALRIRLDAMAREGAGD